MSAEARTPNYPILDDIRVPEDVIAGWQAVVDHLAEIANVPAALVMRVHAKEIEVVVSSHSAGNVYHAGEKAPLNFDLYCETVISTRRELLVPDALKDPLWDKNPDIALGMISYCGLPLVWPSGHVFGTLCILDQKENSYSARIRSLLAQFRDSLQFSLHLLYENSAERKLTAEMRTFIETSPVALAMFDRDLRYLEASQRWRADHLIDNQELRGRPHHEVSPKVSPRLQEAYTRGLAGEVTRAEEDQLTLPEGTPQWLRWEVRPWYDAKGAVGGVLAFSEDITERKRAEAGLQESEEKYRTLVENLHMGLVVHAADTAILLSNPMASSILGLTIDQMRGKTAIDPRWQFLRPDGSQLPLEEYPVSRLFSSGQAFSGQILGISRPDRPTPVWVECSAYPVRDTQGQLAQAVITFFDITARKQAEEEARRIRQKMQDAQKLESLGMLAGGIAHDFNNILTAILGNASLAKIELPPDSPLQEYVGTIIQGSARAADLCKQMLAYSGRGRFVVQRHSLNRLIEDTAGLLAVSVAKKVQLRLDLAASLPPIEADETQIRQVIMNLVINASEAIGELGGEVTVRTFLTKPEADEPLVTDRAPAESGAPEVCLEVADSGCGMNPETLARVFDPFFTTKFTGRGLGLSAVLGIVRGHKGALSVRSTPGAGTTFRVFFPQAVSAAPEAALAAGAKVAGGRSQGCVLLVDDEEVVRRTGALILGRAGYEVVTANDGRQAIELFRGEPGRFALVVMDLSMPQMDGVQALAELRRFRPDVPVVLMSGYDPQETELRFKPDERPAAFLQKPFESEQLLAAARGLRTRGGSAP